MSNRLNEREAEELLLDEAYHRRIAAAIANGLEEWLRLCSNVQGAQV